MSASIRLRMCTTCSAIIVDRIGCVERCPVERPGRCPACSAQLTLHPKWTLAVGDFLPGAK